jgi:hypothetical protein
MNPRSRIAVAIGAAAERIGEAIQDSLHELSVMQLDADLQAADFVHRMRGQTDSLQANVESHARVCGDMEHQIEDAGRPFPGRTE